jgi:DNA-directed RNA polymerase specialized sigma24 family protein
VRRPPQIEISDDLADGTPTPEELAIQGDERRRLMAVVRTLPIAYREVAILLLEGFSTGEIADTLGLTANAVAIRGTRARELLRALLEK